MFKILTSLAATLVFSFAMAQEKGKQASMQDHDKAIETCRSLKIKGSNCQKFADQCHGERDMAACMTEKAKEAKK